MKKILIQVPSIRFSNNKLFNKDINNTIGPWLVLRERLKLLGYDLITADDHSLDDCAWIFYFDTLSFDGIYIPRGGIRAKIKSMFGIKTPRSWPTRPLYEEAIKAGLKDNMVLFLMEGKVVNPHNYSPAVWDKFRYIFTWDDDLVDGKKFIKWYPPFADKESPKILPSFKEKKLLTSVSANKWSNQPNELYSAKREMFQYFSDHYPNDFDLYGYLDIPKNRLEKIFPFLIKKYKTSRGEITDKIGMISKYKFTACYENMKNVNGYVSEKILDAFVARTVPIYWGAENINEYVDPEAFIDRRKFKNETELAKYLFSITEERYNEYLAAGERFLQSEKYQKFLPENLCKTIIDTLNITNQNG